MFTGYRRCLRPIPDDPITKANMKVRLLALFDIRKTLKDFVGDYARRSKFHKKRGKRDPELGILPKWIRKDRRVMVDTELANAQEDLVDVELQVLRYALGHFDHKCSFAFLSQANPNDHRCVIINTGTELLPPELEQMIRGFLRYDGLKPILEENGYSNSDRDDISSSDEHSSLTVEESEESTSEEDKETSSEEEETNSEEEGSSLHDDGGSSVENQDSSSADDTNDSEA